MFPFWIDAEDKKKTQYNKCKGSSIINNSYDTKINPFHFSISIRFLNIGLLLSSYFLYVPFIINKDLLDIRLDEEDGGKDILG